MVRGVNKVILIGNIGVDPDVRYLPNGSAATTLSIATSESWKDKQTGEKQERTEWHRVICFNRLGEIAGEYCRKGTKIYIEGSLRTRKWQDQQGSDRYTTEIIASELQLLDSKSGSSAGSSQTAPPANWQQSSNNTNKQHTADAATANVFEELDDDIPF